MLDGELAVPEDQGITHIDRLSEAQRPAPIRAAARLFRLRPSPPRWPRSAPVAIGDRKALLRDAVGAASCPRLVAVDHIVGIGQQLFAAVRQFGAEASSRSAEAAPIDPE